MAILCVPRPHKILFAFCLWVLFIPVINHGTVWSFAENTNTVEAGQAPQFKLEDFIGDRISWPNPLSAQLKNLTVNLIFPPQHRLLDEANPHIQLFTQDGKFNETFVIKGAVSKIEVNKEINADLLYAQLDIYYCREGALAVCLIQKVLYEIPLVHNKSAEDLDINYQVPN